MRTRLRFRITLRGDGTPVVASVSHVLCCHYTQSHNSHSVAALDISIIYHFVSPFFLPLYCSLICLL